MQNISNNHIGDFSISSSHQSLPDKGYAACMKMHTTMMVGDDLLAESYSEATAQNAARRLSNLQDFYDLHLCTLLTSSSAL